MRWLQICDSHWEGNRLGNTPLDAPFWPSGAVLSVGWLRKALNWTVHLLCGRLSRGSEAGLRQPLWRRGGFGHRLRGGRVSWESHR